MLSFSAYWVGAMATGGGEPHSEKMESERLPTCVIVLGMAGSGKTTWVQRVTAHLHSVKRPPYVVNLDPACSEVPYPANVDIRDTVKYKEVMKQYPCLMCFVKCWRDIGCAPLANIVQCSAVPGITYADLTFF